MADKESKKTGLPNGDVLEGVVAELLKDLETGTGDESQRKQTEDWLRALRDKYPSLGIEAGLRAYYLAEAKRKREEFDSTENLVDRLALGRSIESYLERAGEVDHRRSGDES
ncbi:MAG: hypothetical protein KY459_12850 [Acidobacteria bacterium]|nr:hypothetical protein [Acidobacteriota bacterium]